MRQFKPDYFDTSATLRLRRAKCRFGVGGMEEPRELTRDEIQENFLRHVRAMVNYWRKVPDPATDRLDGLAFSILVAIDGDTADLPGFKITANSCEEDRAYHIAEGNNYYPAPENSPDIGGDLHEKFLHP